MISETHNYGLSKFLYLFIGKVRFRAHKQFSMQFVIRDNTLSTKDRLHFSNIQIKFDIAFSLHYL